MLPFRLNTGHTFKRHENCYWNDEEEENLFDWNVKWPINTGDLFLIEVPMTLSNGIGIPDQKS